MSKKYPIRGIFATTHVDRHGDQLTKEALENMAQDDSVQMINWNHETTLPPIGIVTKHWVEKREDGEFQLVFEGYLFDGEETEFIPESSIGGLDLTQDDIDRTLDEIEPSETGTLSILYDPRNFDADDVKPIIEDINTLLNAEQGFYVRKAELSHPVIWVIVGFIGGQIASGFFSRIGEVAADKAIELAKNFYDQLNHHFNELVRKSKPDGKAPDIIFNIPFPDTETIVEGALESATSETIRSVIDKLPLLYSIAKIIMGRNPKNFFSQMNFLFVPQTQSWEINFFVTASNKVIKGPRYYDPNHPLRERYQQILDQVSTESENG